MPTLVKIKISIKSQYCIGLLKACFHCLQGYQCIIQGKKDLDAILQLTMCACILHNLVIEHHVPPYWLNDNVMELDQEDELNQTIDHSDADTRCNQALDTCWKNVKGEPKCFCL